MNRIKEMTAPRQEKPQEKKNGNLPEEKISISLHPVAKFWSTGISRNCP
jgi:hypothetical protein